MADLNAYFGLDFLAIDLNWYARNFWDIEFYDNSFTQVNGATYEDLLWVNGYDFVADLGLGVAGLGVAFDTSGDIISGQVNAIGEFFWGGTGIWLAEGVDLPAVEVYNAILTPTSNDDFGLIVSALSGNDFIDVSDQADRVSGFDGDDLIYGRFGDDTLYGGSGNDQVYGDEGSDILYGNAGDDYLAGGDGNDILNGGSGNDILDGFQGSDEATGGSGADAFVFFVGEGKLTITDFEPGLDDLELLNLQPDFSISDLLPFVSQQGNDVVIGSGSQEVRFEDTQLSDLSAGDVVFV